MAMTRATQFTIGQYLVAVVIIAYFSAFKELAVLLGILIASLLFVAPVLVIVYFACRFSLGNQRPSKASHMHSASTAGTPNRFGINGYGGCASRVAFALLEH
jgi:hypothetical protein